MGDRPRIAWTRLPGEAAALLPPEARFAAQLPPPRRATWTAGRTALRAALAHAGLHAGPVWSDSGGAPRLPDRVAGSISHGPQWAAAVAGHVADGTLGIDVQDGRPEPALAPAVATRILTLAERAVIAALPAESRWADVLRYFALKEAVFKALWPHLRERLPWHAVAVECAAAIYLPAPARFRIATWSEPFGSGWVAIARARMG
jgi:4'-phosphopantetheinyl transferase EntD